MDDIVDVCAYDGKHSYEDAIQPVEDAYDQLGDRIAILGGIDVDFIIRNPLEMVQERARNMLAKTADKGAYALGSGNSIPEYVPQDKFLGMISVVDE